MPGSVSSVVTPVVGSTPGPVLVVSSMSGPVLVVSSGGVVVLIIPEDDEPPSADTVVELSSAVSCVPSVVIPLDVESPVESPDGSTMGTVGPQPALVTSPTSHKPHHRRFKPTMVSR